MSLRAFVITNLGARAAGQPFYFHEHVGELAKKPLPLPVMKQVVGPVIRVHAELGDGIAPNRDNGAFEGRGDVHEARVMGDDQFGLPDEGSR